MHTSWPKAASSLGRLPMTSATPPSLARGTASVATKRILKRMSFVMLLSHNRRKACTQNVLFVMIPYEKNGCAKQPAGGRALLPSSPSKGSYAPRKVECSVPSVLCRGADSMQKG